MTTANQTYRDLQKHLDELPIGFPPTESGVEIRILKHLFTPEEAEIAKLVNFDAKLGERQNETLFTITAEIENTENVLKQAEQVVQRLKKQLQRLKDLQRILSK